MLRKIHRPELSDAEKFFNININLNKKCLGTTDHILKYSKENNFINESYLDIEQLINENDELELSFEDIKEDGQIIYNSYTNKYKIIINKNQHKTKQCFTMAHEYIHYQFNRDFVQKNAHTDIILYRDATTKLDIDIVANQYASEILMPTTEFEQILKEYKGNILKIAEIFGVSSLAVRYRAKNLGYNDNDL